MTDSADRDAVEQLAEEFLERHRRGEHPTVTEYTKAHPQLADEIGDLFPAILLAERLAAPLPTSIPPQPDQLGDYRILREIGRGGMGVVYEAVQEPLGRRVALKVLPPSVQANPTYRERFQREARAAGRLQHRNIVSVYGVGEQAGVSFMAMQFIAGRGMDSVLREVQRQRGHARTMISADPTPVTNSANGTPAAPPSDSSPADSGLVNLGGQDYFRGVARAGLQVAEALGYAHGQGILHRDIKPSNLIIDGYGTVWVTDFGLAKTQDDGDLTNTGDLVGTLRYMAPERFRGESDPRSDIYGLGMTLYELMALRPAFYESDRAKLIEQVLHDTPTPPRRLDERIPRDLDTIVTKAIAKEPGHRYATADQLAEDLRRFLADQPILARPVRWTEKTWRWCRRNPKLASLTGIIAGLLLLISIASPIIAVRMWDQRRQAQQELWTANLARAESARATNLAGRRFDGLAALDAAHRLVPTLQPNADDLLSLRNHFLASLSLPDLGVARRWPGYPAGSAGVAFDANLERYARSDQHGNVSLRRVHDDTEIAVLPGEGEAAWSLRFSPDGQHLAVGYQPKHAQNAKQIRVWHCDSKSRVIETTSSAYCSDSAFSADSRLVAFGLDDATLAIHDLGQTSRPPRTMTLRVPTNAIAFHPTGRSIAVAQGRQVEDRDLESGRVLKTWNHDRPAGSVAWNSRGTMLAVTSAKVIYLWEMNVPTAYLFRGHERDATEATFSRQGDLLVSRGYDGTIRLWDVERKQPIVRTFNVFTGCSQLQFGPDDRQLGFACDGSHLWTWEIAAGHECRPLHFRGAAISQTLAGDWHPSGSLLAVATNDGVRICSTASAHEVAQLPVPETWTVHWVENALITSGKFGLHRWPIHLVSATQWRIGPPAKLLDKPMEVTETNLSGRCLVARGQDQVLRIIHPDKSRPIAISDHPRAVFAAVSPDSQTVATGTLHDQRVILWNANTGQRRNELPIPGSAALAFSPQGQHLVVASERDYSLWDWAGKKELFTIPKQPEDIPSSISLTNDGTVMLVRHDPTHLRLYEMQSQKALAELQTPTQQTLAWQRISGDGRFILAGTRTGTVYLWNLGDIRRQLQQRGLDWSPPLVADTVSPLPTIEVELDAELYLARAHEHYRAKAYDRAIADAHQALQLVADLPHACFLLASIHVLGPTSHRQPQKALPWAKRAADAHPDRLDYQTVLAVAHYRLEEIDAASAIVEKLRAQADGPILFLSSACHSKKGNVAAAKADYAKGLAWWRKLGTLTGTLGEWTPMLRGEAENLLLK